MCACVRACMGAHRGASEEARQLPAGQQFRCRRTDTQPSCSNQLPAGPHTWQAASCAASAAKCASIAAPTMLLRAAAPAPSMLTRLPPAAECLAAARAPEAAGPRTCSALLRPQATAAAAAAAAAGPTLMPLLACSSCAAERRAPEGGVLHVSAPVQLLAAVKLARAEPPRRSMDASCSPLRPLPVSACVHVRSCVCVYVGLCVAHTVCATHTSAPPWSC
jgi:hypothetical protein